MFDIQFANQEYLYGLALIPVLALLFVKINLFSQNKNE